MHSDDEIEYYATIIAELYSNQQIKEFKPTLNKGVKRNAGTNTNSSNKIKHVVEISNIMYLYINDDFSQIFGKDSIETILKKTILCNLPPKIELTKNGKMKDELKKTIEILKLHINNMNAKNTSGILNDEVIKKNNDLQKLEEKYENCLKNGNFETTTDYKNVATKSLILLNDATKESMYRRNNRIRDITEIEERGLNLYNLIRQKLGLCVEKKERWEREKETREYEYEYNHKNIILADMVCDKLGIEKDAEKIEVKPRINNYHKKFVDNNSTKKYVKSETENKGYVPPHLKVEEPVKTIDKKIEIFDLDGQKQTQNKIIGSWGKKLDFEQLRKKDKVTQKESDKESEKEFKVTQNDENSSDDAWCTTE